MLYKQLYRFRIGLAYALRNPPRMISHDGAYNCPGIVLQLTTVGLFGLESQMQRPWCGGSESNLQVPVRGFHSGVCGFTLGVRAAGLPPHMVRGVGFEPTKCSVTTRAPKSRHGDLQSPALAACLPSYIFQVITNMNHLHIQNYKDRSSSTPRPKDRTFHNIQDTYFTPYESTLSFSKNELSHSVVNII